MPTRPLDTTRKLFKACVGSVAIIVLATIVLVFALQARVRLTDLQPWHQIGLDNEFRHDAAGAPLILPGIWRSRSVCSPSCMPV